MLHLTHIKIKFKGGHMTKYYTGFGTRKILKTDEEYVKGISQTLANLGYKLRTGQMKRGIEAVFRASTLNLEIVKKTETSQSAIDLMGKYHNSWNVIDLPNKKLLGRNAHLVMGKKLNAMSDFVVYYQRELADDSNGVSHTIRVAQDFGVPCFNIAFEEGRDDLSMYLNDQERKKNIKIYSPEMEGIDHINIYSGASTELGRFLSNYAQAPFVCEDGQFASIEGYTQWLANSNSDYRRRNKLRQLSGHEAREYGLNLSDFKSNDECQGEFRRKIKEAIKNKIESNLAMKTELLCSELPFAYYYRKGLKAIAVAELEWVIEFIESYRIELQGTISRPRTDNQISMENVA